MINWIDTHGVESIMIWAAFILISGTIPPLTPNAGFWAKWFYAFMKALALNSRGIGNALNVKMLEINLETGVSMAKKLPSDKADDAGPRGGQ